jgi:hypothetical protein
MDNESKITISNLGTFFFIMVANAVYLCLYYLMAPFSCFKKVRDLRHEMAKEIFWGVFLILGAEGYIDFCLSVFANLEEPYYVTGDD